ncbi:MAG: hypothetical protein COC17_03680 [Hyphomicrobiales bacterium]|nr:MAG: hypothetical protein COC17_03680 [Hyphomicrobiales bacterium]
MHWQIPQKVVHLCLVKTRGMQRESASVSLAKSVLYYRTQLAVQGKYLLLFLPEQCAALIVVRTHHQFPCKPLMAMDI